MFQDVVRVTEKCFQGSRLIILTQKALDFAWVQCLSLWLKSSGAFHPCHTNMTASLPGSASPFLADGFHATFFPIIRATPLGHSLLLFYHCLGFTSHSSSAPIFVHLLPSLSLSLNGKDKWLQTLHTRGLFVGLWVWIWMSLWVKVIMWGHICAPLWRFPG